MPNDDRRGRRIRKQLYVITQQEKFYISYLILFSRQDFVTFFTFLFNLVLSILPTNQNRGVTMEERENSVFNSLSDSGNFEFQEIVTTKKLGDLEDIIMDSEGFVREREEFTNGQYAGISILGTGKSVTMIDSADLRKIQNDQRRLEKTVIDLEKTVIHLEKTITDLRKENADLRKENAENLERQKNELMSMFREEIGKINAKLDEQIRKNAELKRENAEFRRENDEFRRENDEFRRENAESKRENAEFRRENDVFKTRITTLENTVVNAQQIIAQQAKTIKEQQETITDLENKLKMKNRPHPLRKRKKENTEKTEEKANQCPVFYHQGPDFYSKNPEIRRHEIHLKWRAAQGDVEGLRYILDSQPLVNINTQVTSDPFSIRGFFCETNRGFINGTPLMVAALNGNLACVKFLVERKAFLHAMTPGRLTALDYAELKGYVDISNYLKSVGAVNGKRLPIPKFDSENKLKITDEYPRQRNII